MICNTFKRLALDTWDKIALSRRVNFQLKEETLTDLNMLELKLRHPGQVLTTVFSKPEEGVNGADWEWWFNINGTDWIGFRIQAKILNIYSDRFEHLHYRTASTGDFQSDKLIRRALTASPPLIPLYCLYLQTDNPVRIHHWACRSFAPTKDLLGCSLLGAFDVRRLRATNIDHLSDVEQLIKPWHCLVCCSAFGKGNSINNIDGYVKSNFKMDNDLVKDLEITIPASFVTQKPPSYVTTIVQNENYKEILPPDKDLDGIMIYTFENTSTEKKHSS